MDQETKCSTEGEENILPAMTYWIVAPTAQSTEEKKKRKKKIDKLNPMEILKFVYRKTISAK